MGDSPAILREHQTSYPPTPLPIARLSHRELLEEVTGHELAPGMLANGWPDNLRAVLTTDEQDLARAFHLPEAAARRLAAAAELHRRLARWNAPVRPTLNDPALVAELMAPLALASAVERLWCIGLDSHCRMIGQPIEGMVGDVDGVDAGPRAFFRLALQRGAVQAIAVHNHPSGDQSPSAADHAVTKRLVAAGRAIDIRLVDHVVVTADRTKWTSIRRDAPACFA